MPNLNSNTTLEAVPPSLQQLARAAVAQYRTRTLDPLAADENQRTLDIAAIEELVARRGLSYVLTVARNYASETGRG